MSSSVRTTNRPGVSRLVGATIAMLIGALVLVMPNSASALPPPIDGSTGYPAPLPEGCGVDGAAIVEGETFTLAGVTANSMRSLPDAPGSTLTMTWDSFAPGCEGVGVSLSAKSSSSPQFDPGTDQFLLPGYDYCGPLGPACPEGGPYSLSIVVPLPDVAACYQLDAAIGAPLAVVGPSGSFYGLGQSQNMLISALNGGSTPCTASAPTTAAPTTTVAPCATNPALPADSPDCADGSAASTTTVAPCATNPALPADSPDCVTTPTVLGSTTIATTSTTTPSPASSSTTADGGGSGTAVSTSTTSDAGGSASSVSSQPEASVLGATTIAGALATTGSNSNGAAALGVALLLGGLLVLLLVPLTGRN